MANSRTTKISVLCQFAAILLRIFSQNSQLLQCKMGLTSLHDFYDKCVVSICSDFIKKQHAHSIRHILPSEANTWRLKTYLEIEMSQNNTLTLGKLQRCQSHRSDLQITAEISHADLWPLKFCHSTI